MNRFAALLLVLLPALTPAQAAVVCFMQRNLAVPATTEGLYINFLTGVSAETEGGAPGFDFDPYAAASTTPSGQLRFYWGQPATGNAGVVTTGDTYALLAPGSVIGPGSAFSRVALNGDTSAWTAGASGYLGMRFRNEASGVLNYGWARITTTAPSGFPMTVHDWCFEDSAGTIAVPTESIFVDGFES